MPDIQVLKDLNWTHEKLEEKPSVDPDDKMMNQTLNAGRR
jgi:hypothetical protein